MRSFFLFTQSGSSKLTKPIHFRLTNIRIYSTLGRSRSRTYLGILGIILFVLVFVVVAMKLYKRRVTQKTASNGVAFENPSYLREISIEHIPVQVSSILLHIQYPGIQDTTGNSAQQRSLIYWNAIVYYYYYYFSPLSGRWQTWI